MQSGIGTLQMQTCTSGDEMYDIPPGAVEEFDASIQNARKKKHCHALHHPSPPPRHRDADCCSGKRRR